MPHRVGGFASIPGCVVTMWFVVMVGTGWIFSLCPILYKCGQRQAGEGWAGGGSEEEVGGGVVVLG